MNKKTNVRKMVVVAMLGAITVVLGLTPLGFVPVGIINATTMHIPVIVGAILEGPVVGALVGLIFGLSSIFNAITRPTPISFVFYNPLISVVPRILIGIVTYYIYAILRNKEDKSIKKVSIALWVLIIAFLANGLYKSIVGGSSTYMIAINGIFLVMACVLLFVMQKTMKSDLAIMISAFCGSMVNTVLVLSGIYFFFAEKYAEVVGIPLESVRATILGISVTSGIPEGILSVIIAVAVVRAMKKVK